MMHTYASIHEGVFECKTTPEKKTDEIVSPVGPEIINLVGQSAVPIYAVTWNVCTDVSAWREFPRFGIARIEHFQEWTGLGVPLAEEQKIIGQGAWHYC
jgi:hypothetical protein